MKSRLILAVAAVFALSFVTVGTSGAVECKPVCELNSSKGLSRANDAAGDHGANGRAHAPGNQGVLVVASGDGSGDSSGGTGDSGGSTDTNTTTSTDPGPCTGC